MKALNWGHLLPGERNDFVQPSQPFIQAGFEIDRDRICRSHESQLFNSVNDSWLVRQENLEQSALFAVAGLRPLQISE